MEIHSLLADLLQQLFASIVPKGAFLLNVAAEDRDDRRVEPGTGPCLLAILPLLSELSCEDAQLLVDLQSDALVEIPAGLAVHIEIQEDGALYGLNLAVIPLFDDIEG